MVTRFRNQTIVYQFCLFTILLYEILYSVLALLYLIIMIAKLHTHVQLLIILTKVLIF